MNLETKIYVLRAITKKGEVVVLPQSFATISVAEKAAQRILSKKKFIGDDKKLYAYSEISKFQVVNSRNLEVEKEI